MRFLHRVIAATVFAVAVVAAGARAFPSLRIAPPLYLIEGYIDQAPDDSKVIDRVDVTTEGSGKPVRWLLVTSYRAAGGVLLNQYLSRVLRHPWLIRGKREDVTRLLDASAGSRVEGTFLIYSETVPSLFIADLDQPGG